MTTQVYFVRHAQPEFAWEDDRTRPLTEEGRQDSKMVLDFLKDKDIDVFYCSPYKRSYDTIADTAAFYGREIITDERLREREKGINGNTHEMFEKRWADHDYHEENGESIHMVQRRNIEALLEILAENEGKKIVIGTHGTALSAILNFYRPKFACRDFLRLIDWMPYIIELDFEGDELSAVKEHCYIEKEFPGRKEEAIDGLQEKFEFRDIRPEEGEQAARIEQICFPPKEACSKEMMLKRIARAPGLFLVAVDKSTGKIAGFLNGLATEEDTFRDEFFTDADLHDPAGENIMLLGLDVLPQYRMQGLARELMSCYLRRESQKGRRMLLLTCLDSKVEMYKKMGFSDRGIANSTWGGSSWHEMGCVIER